MKLLGETNCLVFDDLTDEELMAYFEQFGEEYWNADENIVCVPMAELIQAYPELKEKYNQFFETDVSKANYVIIELNESHEKP